MKRFFIDLIDHAPFHVRHQLMRGLNGKNLARVQAWLASFGVPLAVVTLIIVQFRHEQYLFTHANWLGWSDQRHYLESARAWASFSLLPQQHHYPPGYALMGVPFLRLFPLQPFLVPDLACAAISLILFTHLCARMAPTMPQVRIVAALCFLIATCGGARQLDIWAQPWTTTAACPFLLGTLLLALRCAAPARANHIARDAALLGLVAGLGMMVRPSDLALLLLIGIIFAAAQCLRLPSPWSTLRRLALFGMAGLLVGLAPFMIAHLAIFGFGASDYLGDSAALGFEWRSIPMQWVLLVVSPRPLLPEGTGMAAAFPFLWPGIAGMVFAVPTGIRQRAITNVLVACAIISYWLLYLAYRDLHPYGLWRFYNVHYFKWVLPFFAFWTYELMLGLASRANRRAAMAAFLGASLLFLWQAQFQPQTHGQIPDRPSRPVNEITIPAGLATLDRAIMVQAIGDWTQLYFTQPHSARIDGVAIRAVGDLKLFPGPGGGLLVPLRPLPPGAVTLTLPPPAYFPPGTKWIAGRQHLRFGIPCLIVPHWGDCAPDAYAPWRALAHGP